MIVRASQILTLSILAIVCSLGAKQTVEFRDFSQKGTEYAALADLRFVATDITYAGSQRVDILGKTYDASRYRLPTTVRVEVSDAVGPVNTSVYRTQLVTYDIHVVNDQAGAIHDELIKEMYRTWSERKLFLGEYFFDFKSHEKQYLLSAIPNLVDVKCFYFVWVNGRAIKISFHGEKEPGWGTMSRFTSENFRISLDNVLFKAYEEPVHPQKEFLRLYERGFFNLHGSDK